jgi:hypothetical protein
MLPNESIKGVYVGHFMCIVSTTYCKDLSEICCWLRLRKLLSAFPVGRYWSNITPTYLSSNQTSQDFGSLLTVLVHDTKHRPYPQKAVYLFKQLSRTVII